MDVFVLVVILFIVMRYNGSGRTKKSHDLKIDFRELFKPKPYICNQGYHVEIKQYQWWYVNTIICNQGYHVQIKQYQWCMVCEY